MTSADSGTFDVSPGAVSAARLDDHGHPDHDQRGRLVRRARPSPSTRRTRAATTLTSSGGAVVLATDARQPRRACTRQWRRHLYGVTECDRNERARPTITGTIAGTPIGHTTSVTFAPPVPVVTIDGGQPAAQTAVTSASFTFHSPNDDGNTTFECRLDAAVVHGRARARRATRGSPTVRHVPSASGASTATGQAPRTPPRGRSTPSARRVSLTTSPGAFTNNAVEPLAATASDATTTVASVDFLFAATAGACPTGTLIDTDTSAPYTATWTTPGDGTYVVCAVAHDVVGNASAAPSTTTVTVDQTPPLATLTAPPANVRQTITLHATSVTDATSGVASVDLRALSAQRRDLDVDRRGRRTGRQCV